MEYLQHLPAIIVGIIAIGRGARLLTHDDFPPAEAVRNWYVRHAKKEGWDTLFLCPFCMAPYLTAGDMAWYLLADGWLLDAWWIVNVWAAVSYLAAILVARDEPE